MRFEEFGEGLAKAAPPKPARNGVWKRAFVHNGRFYVVTTAKENVWSLPLPWGPVAGPPSNPPTTVPPPVPNPLPTPTPTPTPTPLPTPAAAVARYRVTFESTWSRESHPVDFPNDAHFSPLIGGTHSSQARFWMPGGLATPGIQAMAERGRVSPLDTEVQAAIAAGTAFSVIRSGAIDRSPGVATADFEIGRDHPLVTLVTMVAPSPDWFVGASGLSLIENGAWVEQKVVLLHPYDAGTDSGITFTSADAATQPREPIRRIDMGPLVEAASVPYLGTFTFRRIS